MKNTKDPLILIEKMRGGDEKAFDDLCEKYSPLIEKICEKYKNSIEADEIRQICRMKLHRIVSVYREDMNVTFGRYAKSCMENAVRSEIRRLKAKKGPQKEDIPETVIDPTSPEDELIARERMDELIELIRVKLSPYEREVFVLYYAGKSYAEIAHLTKRSERSVGTALTRAKAKLRKIRK